MDFISGQVIFIVWREAVEAILIIGIIYAFLQKMSVRSGLRFMYGGVFAGVLLSVILGFLMMRMQESLEGNSLVFFESGILLLSSLLMTQMVYWMSKHGRHLKGEIEKGLGSAVEQSNLWGVAAITALSVAREGVETVIYLYGIALQGKLSATAMAANSLLALALALFMGWVVSKGFRYFNMKVFFKLTGAALLISGGALLTKGFGKLVGENILPGLVEPVWNTSPWLSGEGTFANIITSFVGYNPRPSLTEVLAYASYWTIIALIFKFKILEFTFKKTKTLEV